MTQAATPFWERIASSAPIRFFSRDLWQLRLGDLPGWQAALVRFIRALILSGRGFFKDQCPLWATCLTFYTLMAVVPTAALAFVVAKGFGMRRFLEDWLLSRFDTHVEIVQYVITFADRLLESTRGGVMAFAGVTVLLFSALRVIGNIERAFNHIWKIHKSRNILRKLTDYLTILVIGPLLIVAAGSVTVYIHTVMARFAATGEMAEMVGSIVPVVFRVTPVVLVSLWLTLLYLTMPNHRVRLGSAILAGIMAGVLYQFVQWGYIHFQVGVSRANAVYGSFAALPLFLVWLQISWFIVLFGAEVSHAHQSAAGFDHSPMFKKISRRSERLIALEVVQLIARRFRDNKPALDATAIADRLRLPESLLEDLLDLFVIAGVLCRIEPVEDGPTMYQPAADTRHLTVASVIATLDRHGDSPREDDSDMRHRLAVILNHLDEEMAASPENQPLDSI